MKISVIIEIEEESVEELMKLKGKELIAREMKAIDFKPIIFKIT